MTGFSTSDYPKMRHDAVFGKHLLALEALNACLPLSPQSRFSQLNQVFHSCLAKRMGTMLFTNMQIVRLEQCHLPLADEALDLHKLAIIP